MPLKQIVDFASIELTVTANKTDLSLQQQLYQHCVQRIRDGRFKAGAQLPPSRQLAKELGVSRNTLLATFDQLIAEGFLQSKMGSAVRISTEFANQQLANAPSLNQSFTLPALSEFALSLQQNQSNPHGNLPFTPGLVDLEAFNMSIWQTLLRRHRQNKALFGYGHHQGLPALRHALVDYLVSSRGVRCQAEQIIITSGAQQGISLCAQLLLNPNSQVLIEEPGYNGAKRAFAALQHQCTPIALQGDVLDVHALPTDGQAQLLYCTPTHQYPMGGSLSASERQQLLLWASQQQCWVIEDDYDSEFHFQHKPISAMQGIAPNAPVIYMGSFSKTVFPGLRLGYLVVPKGLEALFSQAKMAMTGETALLNQQVLADFIDQGHFVRHVRKMRQLYQCKWQHFHQLLSTLPAPVTVLAQGAGMHLVLQIANIDDHHLKHYLQQQGFGCSTLSSYYLTRNKQTGLVLGFANSNALQREQLTQAIRDYLKQMIG